jgi:guanine deaminase
MNQNCPADLRVDEVNLERHLISLAERFGRRVVLTDRFAVAVSSPLRRRAVAIAARFGLLHQTHLNEQVSEKRLVEESLYPDAGSYTEVYRRDGLLDAPAILAHCIHMTDPELEIIRRHRSAVAHCPTSNTLLDSGVMPLDRMCEQGIDYAVCTDVGASPTTSLLAEMAQFLKVHSRRSRRATPSEALFRTTLAPAALLGLADRIGSLSPSMDFTFVEIDCAALPLPAAADDVILRCLLEFSQEEGVAVTANRLDRKINRVTERGKMIWQRSEFHRPGASADI